MNVLELQIILRDPSRIHEKPFEILRHICQLRNSGYDEQIVQELILRALEHRQLFGPASAVLDALVRDVGLFPYLQPDELSAADRLALEIHRAPDLERVFHHPQAKVFHAIMSGRSVVLSAPTSFGKSLIIDALVATRKFKNIVIVVPTLALIDETRRRLGVFRSHYNIITQSFQVNGERNIYVMTQERVLDSSQIGQVDFFVIDEFYKLNPSNEQDERAALLNQVFYQLSKKCKHFYLLGPGIQGLSEDFRHSLRFEFMHEPYHTVVSELHPINPGRRPLEKLREIAASLTDPTLVFCGSPERAGTVAGVLPTSKVSPLMEGAVEWIAEHYHPEWHLVKAMSRGIGIHHGRIPRALAQYIVKAFNDGELPFLVCTSTLIEGVNTKAKNIVIYDHKINRQAIDLFTFNNIRGRSGRMFQHYVGHVYIFHEPPQEGLPFIDVPAFSQGTSASDSLLVQIEKEDLTDEADERVRQYRMHAELPLSVIRESVGVPPDAQVAVADELAADAVSYSQKLAWQGIPSFNDLLPICELIWTFFGGSSLGSGSAKTPRQLAMMLLQLAGRPSIRELVRAQLPFSNHDPDQAVRAVLDFQRLWATFNFPRLLRTIDRIQRVVFSKRSLPVGSYDQYTALVENLFLSPALVALEEYGIPLPLARKLEPYVGVNRGLEEIIGAIKRLPLDRIRLSSFERSLIEDARNSM